MESQPLNPEFRLILKTFTHVKLPVYTEMRLAHVAPNHPLIAI